MTVNLKDAFLIFKDSTKTLLLFLFFFIFCFRAYCGDSPLDRVTIYSNQEISEDLTKEYFNLFNAGWDQVLLGSEREFEIDYGDSKVTATVSQKEGGKTFLEIIIPNESGEDIKLGQFLSETDISQSTLENLGLDHKVVGSPYHFVDEAKLSQLDQLSDISRQANLLNMGDEWGTKQLETLDEIHYLYGKLVNRWKELAEKEHPVRNGSRVLTDTEFKEKFIDKNAVYFENGLGKAELNSIDGVPFVRILHYGTELSFVIRKGTTIENASEHFQQYIARQHIVANSNRPMPERGRDVVVLTVDDFSRTQNLDILLDSSRYETLKRQIPYSKAWWLEYWRAVKKFPTWSSFSFGLVCGAVQGGLAFSTGMFIDSFVAPLEFNLVTTSAFTAAWGTVFGSISSMFKNWVNMGPTFSRTVKNMTNGILFQYILTFLIFGGWDAFLNPLTHGLIFTASYLSNRAKPNWYNFAILRERVGVATGDVNVGWGPISTKWKRSNIEFQLAYMPAFVTRFMERTNLGINRMIPVGQGILVAAIPFSEYLFMKYAQRVASKTGHPAAREMAERAEREWQVKKALFTDVRTHGLIFKKYFHPRKSQRQAAREALREKYPTVFKRPIKKKVGRIVTSSATRPFRVPSQGNACLNKLIQLI